MRGLRSSRNLASGPLLGRFVIPYVIMDFSTDTSDTIFALTEANLSLMSAARHDELPAGNHAIRSIHSRLT